VKIHENKGREPLSEDIGELRRGGHMKNTNCTHGDSFTDEVKVNFHMLGALMLNGVGGEVDGADIVVVDEAGRVLGMMEFLE